MEIARKQLGDILELTITGRLDGAWAEHLSKELATVLSEGNHQVQLDLSEVKYLSSAGIGVLMQFYKQFDSLKGWIRISQASPQIRSVLELTRLDKILIGVAKPAAPKAPLHRQMERDGVHYEIFDTERGATLKCNAIGKPDRLVGCGFEEKDSRPVKFPRSTFAVGVGAFGDNFADCRAQFGEFLAVAGATTCLPTDGSNVPDFMLAKEDLVPELNVLYGLACEGRIAQQVRFDTGKTTRPIALTALLEACLDVAESDTIGAVIAAESAGLMGTALRRSPALGGKSGNGGDPSAPFGFPDVRGWLSFSAEQSHRRSLTLAAGVVTRREVPALASWLRPLHMKKSLTAHVHAAVFSYRPLQKGMLDLNTTVKTLFEGENPLSVLHLLSDDREIHGGGESEFVRGACWFSPLSGV